MVCSGIKGLPWWLQMLENRSSLDVVSKQILSFNVVIQLSDFKARCFPVFLVQFSLQCPTGFLCSKLQSTRCYPTGMASSWGLRNSMMGQDSKDVWKLQNAGRRAGRYGLKIILQYFLPISRYTIYLWKFLNLLKITSIMLGLGQYCDQIPPLMWQHCRNDY